MRPRKRKGRSDGLRVDLVDMGATTLIEGIVNATVRDAVDDIPTTSDDGTGHTTMTGEGRGIARIGHEDGTTIMSGTAIVEPQEVADNARRIDMTGAGSDQGPRSSARGIVGRQ